MDNIEAMAIDIDNEIQELEREIKWHKRNDNISSWECERLMEMLRDKENQLKALGY